MQLRSPLTWAPSQRHLAVALRLPQEYAVLDGQPVGVEGGTVGVEGGTVGVEGGTVGVEGCLSAVQAPADVGPGQRHLAGALRFAQEYVGVDVQCALGLRVPLRRVHNNDA